MASRKTYFGMGFKDPSDPESGPAAKTEQEDRSAPTIVDDEKVAEGLRQLRSWYQGEDQTPGNLTATPSPPVSTPASSIGGPQARPTAVGHATGPPPSAAQRPVAPDPMRATMYGHDVHQFDLDLPASGGEATPAASSTALVLADPGSGQHAVTRQAGVVPAAAAWPQSDSFNLARGGEAERLQRPAGLRRSSREIRPKTRMPMMARVMFAGGLLSLVAAILIYLGSGGESDTPSVQPGPAPMPAPPARPMPPAAVPETPPVVPAVAPPSDRGSSPQAPTRPLASPPAAVPLPSVTAPKSERPRTPTTPATLRTPRRPREAKVEEPKAADGDGESSGGAKAPAEKEKPSGKPHADVDETMPPSEE